MDDNSDSFNQFFTGKCPWIECKCMNWASYPHISEHFHPILFNLLIAPSPFRSIC